MRGRGIKIAKQFLTSGGIIDTVLSTIQYVVLFCLFPIVIAIAIGAWIIGVTRMNRSIDINVRGFGLTINIKTGVNG